MTFKELYLSFNGRICRRIFWIYGVLLVAPIAFIVRIASGDGLNGPTVIGSLVIFFATLPLMAKRFHDRNKSAWWVLITLIPVIGQLWAVIELQLLKGTVGPNRFGNDPVDHQQWVKRGPLIWFSLAIPLFLITVIGGRYSQRYLNERTERLNSPVGKQLHDIDLHTEDQSREVLLTTHPDSGTVLVFMNNETSPETITSTEITTSTYQIVKPIEGRGIILYFWNVYPSQSLPGDLARTFEEVWQAEKDKEKGIVVLGIEPDFQDRVQRISGNKGDSTDLAGVIALQSRDFIKDNNLTYTNLHDPYWGVARLYDINNLPETIFIAPNGIVKCDLVLESVDRAQIDPCLEAIR